MLPRKHRIPTSFFSGIKFQGARRYHSPHLALIVSKYPGDLSRFSFSASKKVLKTAVARNRFRRVCFSEVEKTQSLIMGGFLYFFTAKKGIADISSKELRLEVEYLLKNLK